MNFTTDTREAIDQKVTQLIVSKIHELLKTQDKVILGIPGGRSFLGIFDLLKKQTVPWGKVHIFMVDERLVDTDSPQSNFRQAWDACIQYLVEDFDLPRENMHPYTYYNQPVEEGLEAYKTELKEIADGFDIILLSSGEDGHVASLFPNNDSIKDGGEFFISVPDSPKPPAGRISASRKMLQKAKLSILLFLGEEKKQALENFNSSVSITECPAKLVNEISESYVFTDLK